MNKNNCFDFLRFLFAFDILLAHLWELSESSSLFFLSSITDSSIAIKGFFVISGFLIGSILFKEIATTGKINFKKFYIRRFLRLMPVYLFTMLICIYLYNDNINTFWSNLLYINNYVPNSYMLHTWSLAIEEQFYIVIPFLLLYVLPKFKNKIYFFLIFFFYNLRNR